MNKYTHYEHLSIESLIALRDKKLAQLALSENNKFNLKRKCIELNEDISAIRVQISRKSQKKGDKDVK